MKYFTLAFKNFAKFKGRANRREFWWFVLINLIISFVLGFISGAIFKTPILSNIYSLVTLIPYLSLTWRRMQDSEKPGWFLIIPFYNLYLAIIKGTEGPNKYGPESMA